LVQFPLPTHPVLSFVFLNSDYEGKSRMNRRQFLGVAGLGAVHGMGLPRMAEALFASQSPATAAAGKSFGSGHFGEWITDRFGLPAYRYTCKQSEDPKAVTPVHKEWRSATDHSHQVGNDRVVAVVSNYGYVQVRQDEGSPKFLNDYSPENGLYGAGLGFLTDGFSVLSTYYPGNVESFERILGEGYFQKTVKGYGYTAEQVIFAPFSDDPVLISMVSISNGSTKPVELRWVEYWGCQNWQFSYRSWMEAGTANEPKSADLRRQFGGRFRHQFELLPENSGLLDRQEFLGRSTEEEQAWAAVQAELTKNPSGFFGEPRAIAAPAAIEDLSPPATFLVSLDSEANSWGTDARGFFGAGGPLNPSGLANPLDGNISTSGTQSALLLERRMSLRPNERRTIAFLYGYLPQGFEVENLVAKYRVDPQELWSQSSERWKKDGVRLAVPAEPWVERETSWHNYYLRSNLTYDSFFREHILSQGHVYQYIFGFQGAARDPLQHMLPFIFSNADAAREVIRYTLKEIQPDSSIPYGIVGSGVPMPVVFRPSDLEMWLLWAASEYVLATRNREFLEERIPAYPRQESAESDAKVGELLERSFQHMVRDIGVGEHALMRLSNGDWNDDIVVGHVPHDLAEEVRREGESVLNAAMASYVFDHYGRMLSYIGDTASAEQARSKAEEQRNAVRNCFSGQWFRRAWLGPQLGWIGEDHIWLEPQPWAIIGGAATPDQNKTLGATIEEYLRRPSLIGALLQNPSDPTMGSVAGVLTNGGVWPSINGTLIWALALIDGTAAWDEWKKNSLAAHAEAYPDIWYGIWSGPDSYNSVLSRYPGQTMFAETPVPDQKRQPDWGVNWTDFPVMNMHPHAWPLYSAAKLLGTEFHEKGIRFQPTLPIAEYAFTSPLLSFEKTKRGYSGSYAPSAPGSWEVALQLTAAELDRIQHVKVNGESQTLSKTEKAVIFRGESRPDQPLTWDVS
jgi:hypothetical protein